MQRTYIAWTQSKTIRVLPVKTPFLRLLNELERAESDARKPSDLSETLQRGTHNAFI
jgi:hypothetical protein